MGYYLMFSLNANEEDIPENVKNAKKLLMEVVGYSERDAEKLIFMRPDETILVNLTIEEALNLSWLKPRDSWELLSHKKDKQN